MNNWLKFYGHTICSDADTLKAANYDQRLSEGRPRQASRLRLPIPLDESMGLEGDGRWLVDACDGACRWL